MAFEQINTADFDYQMMLATINAAYIGKAEITLSNYDNDSAPVIKVGAKIEVNGALIKLTTSDATPTGYAGITNSTTFFLYYDSSAGVAIYSNTVPVWNDALQGWYNGNDRAFFSMFKDSGGTLYENKLLLINQSNNQISGGIQTDNALLKTKVIEIGDWNMDSTAFIDIAHGVSDYTKIRNISVMIIEDAPGTNIYSFGDSLAFVATIAVTQYVRCNATNITLFRDLDGLFDDTDFDSTSYNRGWITIQYEG